MSRGFGWWLKKIGMMGDLPALRRRKRTTPTESWLADGSTHSQWARAMMLCRQMSPYCGADGYCHAGGDCFDIDGTAADIRDEIMETKAKLRRLQIEYAAVTGEEFGVLEGRTDA